MTSNYPGIWIEHIRIKWDLPVLLCPAGCTSRTQNEQNPCNIQDKSLEGGLHEFSVSRMLIAINSKGNHGRHRKLSPELGLMYFCSSCLFCWCGVQVRWIRPDRLGMMNTALVCKAVMYPFRISPRVGDKVVLPFSAHPVVIASCNPQIYTSRLQFRHCNWQDAQHAAYHGHPRAMRKCEFALVHRQ